MKGAGQILPGEGFGQHGQVAGDIISGFVGIAAHQHNPHVRTVAQHQIGQLAAIDAAGHDDVADDRWRCQGSARSFPVACTPLFGLDDRVAEIDQLLADDAPDIGVILDQQHQFAAVRQAVASSAGASLSASGVVSGSTINTVVPCPGWL